MRLHERVARGGANTTSPACMTPALWAKSEARQLWERPPFGPYPLFSRLTGVELNCMPQGRMGSQRP